MASVTQDDIARMTAASFIDGPLRGRPSSRFWVLLVLSAIIATAGVVADSTATVIGAMIVAPLMTPILGVALAVVLADRVHLIRSIAFVLGGALAVIAIAYVIGIFMAPPDDFASNGQVAARISPHLVDLLAALATGLVGAFALVRSDISDTLPGVAIAISLVPPLAVVGLLLEVQRWADAGQALLLFGTNVAAIIATGTVVLLVYRVRITAKRGQYPVGRLRGSTLAVVVAGVLIVAIPLAIGTNAVASDQRLAARAQPVIEGWAATHSWQIAGVTATNGALEVDALAPRDASDPSSLRTALDDAGIADADLTVHLGYGVMQYCAAGADVCVSDDVTATTGS